MAIKDYLMIGKCLYLTKLKILAIGDLHLGYEEMLHKQGVMIPLEQMRDTLTDLRNILEELKKRKLIVNKVVMLGDIAHQFNYNKQEKLEILELFNFLKGYVSDKNIIVIRGNHDPVNIWREFKEIYIDKDVAFIHGDKDFLELWDKKIKIIIMGHEHPKVNLREEEGAKNENYKCFLEGKFKGKQLIILPSFLNITLGKDILDQDMHQSIVPSKNKSNFEVYVVNDNLKEEALWFGKLKNIN